eukprot:TRINITY_DN773184_c0_g1_i1.p1 TRINITY_DN773184_c0_g1~~TRINITY_DN773184_c0_g1_i1.p1  ORF type:complete len:176 (-),score=68.77 TRINITY_DN773184_c0_g1_i1:168-695(-)
MSNEEIEYMTFSDDESESDAPEAISMSNAKEQALHKAALEETNKPIKKKSKKKSRKRERVVMPTFEEDDEELDESILQMADEQINTHEEQELDVDYEPDNTLPAKEKKIYTHHRFQVQTLDSSKDTEDDDVSKNLANDFLQAALFGSKIKRKRTVKGTKRKTPAMKFSSKRKRRQ